MYMNNLIAFFITSLFFLLIAIYSGRNIMTVKDYFHRSGSVKWFLSLSASNITLGTGVVYYLSSSAAIGGLMLLSPLMVLIGYLIFASIINKTQILYEAPSGNFLKWADKKTTDNGEAFNKNISFYPTISLVLTFILILAYEIHASAKIFSQILFTNPTSQTVVLIAGLLAAITMVYTLWGGVVVVLKTDLIQIFGVIAVIALLGLASIIKAKSGTASFSIPLLPDSHYGYWTLLAAVCGALATQFYSLLNWGAVSNFEEGKSPAWTLRGTGLLTFIMLSVLVLVGLISGKGAIGASFKSLIENPFLKDPNIWSLILVAGMVCIVFSTADSLMIQITMFSYDNLIGGNSIDIEPSAVSIRNLRLIALFAFALVFTAVFIFIVTQKDLLYLLFAVAGGVIVYAPFMFLLLYISINPKIFSFISKNISITFFILFVISFGANVLALVYNQRVTSIVVVLSFVISCVVAGGFYFTALRRA